VRHRRIIAGVLHVRVRCGSYRLPAAGGQPGRYLLVLHEHRGL